MGKVRLYAVLQVHASAPMKSVEGGACLRCQRWPSLMDCSQEALGTDGDVVANSKLHPTYQTETLVWPGTQRKKKISQYPLLCQTDVIISCYTLRGPV